MEGNMKTRTLSLFVVISLVAILLTACSGGTVATVSADSGLSAAARLAVGTLKLEGTSNAVTTSEAGDLLTLWEAYRSLSNSDTTSQIELDALVKQIEGTMTSEQTKSIDAMNLSEQSASDVVQSMGSSIGVSVSSSTPDSSAQSQPAQAGGPGGMPADGGGNPMSDITGGMGTQSTPSATQAITNSASTQVDQMLLNTLIQLLKTRSQGSS
jgi:hypothetical protein